VLTSQKVIRKSYHKVIKRLSKSYHEKLIGNELNATTETAKIHVMGITENAECYKIGSSRFACVGQYRVSSGRRCVRTAPSLPAMDALASLPSGHQLCLLISVKIHFSKKLHPTEKVSINNENLVARQEMKSRLSLYLVYFVGWCATV
jgi:hypothetical protein